jgi:hypothetical protein
MKTNNREVEKKTTQAQVSESLSLTLDYPEEKATNEKKKEIETINDESKQGVYFLSISYYYIKDNKEVIPCEIGVRWSDLNNSKSANMLVKTYKIPKEYWDIHFTNSKTTGITKEEIFKFDGIYDVASSLNQLSTILSTYKNADILVDDLNIAKMFLKGTTFENRLVDFSKFTSKFDNMTIMKKGKEHDINIWKLSEQLSFHDKCPFHKKDGKTTMTCTQQKTLVMQQHYILYNTFVV